LTMPPAGCYRYRSANSSHRQPLPGLSVSRACGPAPSLARLKAKPMIHIRQLDFTYSSGSGQKALGNICLDIEPGRYVLICGRSGSGKSTLCRTFNGLIPHFHPGKMEGTVTVAGRPTSETLVQALFDKVALVFQNPEAQLFSPTVKRELAFGLESLGMPAARIERQIAAVAAELGLENLLELDPHKLSGGQQHLVTLAAMLALKPRILVLDEPFANLDGRHVQAIRRILARLRAEGLGIVVCEHRLRPTVADADRIVVIDRGTIVLDGPCRRVLGSDLRRYGLQVPLAVELSRKLGLQKIHTDLQQVASEAKDIPLQEVSPSPRATGQQAGDVILSTRHLSARTGGLTILDDINLEIQAGSCLAIVGANGAGKTTLLRHLNGLARPSGGRLLLKGKDVTRARASALARHVGTAFQNPADQFFKLKVSDEIAVTPRITGNLDQGWIDELAQRFGLEKLMQRAPFRLSAGEKKRVAFAAALAGKPEILILDEPTAGQDADFREALGKTIRDLTETGHAVIIITHDLEFAHSQAGRWIVMAGGRILRQGRPEVLMADRQLMDQAGLEPTERFLWQRYCAGKKRCLTPGPS